MTTVTVGSSSSASAMSWRATDRLGTLAVAGGASLAAGAVHAAAIGVHAEHHQAVVTFTVVAAFQLAWGAVALSRSGRLLAAVGAIGNAALVGGWVMAKTSGISFIDGLEVPEGVQIADGLAAGLAVVAVLAAAMVFLGGKLARAFLPGRGTLVGITTAMLAVLAFPGMLAAGSHVHSHGAAADGHTHGTTAGTAADPTHTHAPAVVPPTVYDPTQPLNFGGLPGVTLEQQARAENLVAVTLFRLPQFADPATAEAMGYFSIGDGFTGYEHYIKWELIDDGKILDPDYPESLVYRVQGGTRTLAAAMYMLPTGTTLAQVPDIGGPLTQWHIHDNLCFTNDPVSPHVAGITSVGGTCSPPLVKFDPVPMIHVWIVPHPCGPFAALEGVGGGQIAEGETRLCDHVHGTG
jgi:hypothetical protein